MDQNTLEQESARTALRCTALRPFGQCGIKASAAIVWSGEWPKPAQKQEIVQARTKNDDFLHRVRNKLRSEKQKNNPDLLSDLAEGLQRQATINKASDTGIFQDPNPFVKPGCKVYSSYILF